MDFTQSASTQAEGVSKHAHATESGKFDESTTEALKSVERAGSFEALFDVLSPTGTIVEMMIDSLPIEESTAQQLKFWLGAKDLIHGGREIVHGSRIEGVREMAEGGKAVIDFTKERMESPEKKPMATPSPGPPPTVNEKNQ